MERNKVIKRFSFQILNLLLFILISCEFLNCSKIKDLEVVFNHDQNYFYQLSSGIMSKKISLEDSSLILIMEIEVSEKLGVDHGYYISTLCYNDKYQTISIDYEGEVSNGYIYIEDIYFMNCLMSNYNANIFKNKNMKLKIKQLNNNWLCFENSRYGVFKEIEDIYNCE